MRKTTCGMLGLMLTLAMVMIAAAGLAETWNCKNCGQQLNTGNYCSNCGHSKGEAAAALESSGAEEKAHDGLWRIPGETDRVEVGVSRVDASSYISNKKNPYLWEPSNANDHDESTCWQFSAKKGLKGKSWISLDLEYGEAVDEIWFKNGFWGYNDKGGEQYSINARPRNIRVEITQTEGVNSETVTLTLRDESFSGWQKFDLGRHEDVGLVTVYIDTIYKGSRYPNDVCLSEIMLVQKASPAIAREPWWSTPAAKVYESIQDMTKVHLLMKLATRSGPGRQYDEPGTFFGKNWKTTTVRALGKSWDGNTWWVLVDFSNSGKASYRVWTGLKRLDLNIDQLKEINPIGQGTVNATSRTYRGPGENYVKAKVNISGWKDVVAYGRENGFVEVEFIQGSRWYRVWVPEAETSIDWGNDFSGEN